MANDFPSFTDGKRGLRDPSCVNLNVLVDGLPLAYHWIKDSLKVAGRSIDHELEGEGDHLGSDTKSTGAKKGSVSLQLNRANDPFPVPGHVLQIDKWPLIEFYVVTETPEDMERNQVVKPAVTVTQIVNPFFKGLLSADEGDTLRVTKSIAAVGITTLDPKPVNHRALSTKAYSALLLDDSPLPVGVTIDPLTGLLSFDAATLEVGVYTLIVTATDVLLNKTKREGFATLVLTVTA